MLVFSAIRQLATRYRQRRIEKRLERLRQIDRQIEEYTRELEELDLLLELKSWVKLEDDE